MSVCPSTTVDPVDTRQQIQNTKIHSHKVLCTRTNTHINQLINKPTKTRTKPSLPKHYSLHETIILLLLLQLNVLRLLKEVLNTFGNFCQSCWLPVAAKHTDHMFFSYIFFFLNNPLGLPGFILLFNMHILRFILFFLKKKCGEFTSSFYTTTWTERPEMLNAFVELMEVEWKQSKEVWGNHNMTAKQCCQPFR